MSREIKFRAWDTTEKPGRMTYFNPLELTESYQQIAARENGDDDFWIDDRFSGQPADLMQYTGLKDNNAVEIYEGDVVRIGNSYKARVVWDERAARFLLQPIGAGVMSTKSLTAVVIQGRVIGNIYENPELLGSRGGDV